MKLKSLKTAIKVWCKDEDVTVCRRIKVVTQLQDIFNQLLLSPLSENLHKEEHKLKSELNKWLAHEEEEPRQKSREVRLQLGDRNTKYFHASIKNRQARNCINHLYDNCGVEVSDLDGVRSMDPAFYSNLFNQSDYWTTFPNTVIKKQLTSEAQALLTRVSQRNQGSSIPNAPSQLSRTRWIQCWLLSEKLGACFSWYLTGLSLVSLLKASC